MHKTVGIVAHVDAGKTTFSEQLLFHTNSIRQRGRVDHKDAFLDSHAIEKNRGITVFADQASFTFQDSHYTLIDTPGHVDFSPEMERALQVMDIAIIIISAADGIEGHTETVWHLLQKHGVPTFFFINKTDREGADTDSVTEEIRSSFSADIFDITELTGTTMSETLIEFIAERDENLLEHYMTTGYDERLWLDRMKQMIHNREIFAYGLGSALKDIGVLEFFEHFDRLTETDYNKIGEFAGRVYKIRHDEKGQRITFIKILQGMLRVRDELKKADRSEKITQIRQYSGNQFTATDAGEAGEIVAVTGLTLFTAGESIGAEHKKAAYNLMPALQSNVIFDPSVHMQDMLHYFTILDAEDPSLRVEWNEIVQEIHVHVMGVIQLEVLQQIVKDRFQINVSFGNPSIIYKESIRSAVNGYGHFEPLKHYAEVHLKLEPAARDSGISFKNHCHANDLSAGNQNLVERHVFEQAHHGLLTGSALTDVTITLLTGKGHNEHTSGGDFREATFRAIRQGLEKAENILLEPYYDFKIKVEMDHIGRVLSDIQQAHGNFTAPETTGSKTVLTGRVPVSTFLNYSTVFASFTNGKGSLTLKFGGYGECHNTEEVINRIGYNKDADPQYTSSSIFCTKGKGYAVPWDEAEAAMHLL